MLLQIVEVYNGEKQIEYTVYASDSIQQEGLPVSLEVGRIYISRSNIGLIIIRPICAKTFIAKEANKLSMQVKIGIRFHRAEITYFEISRLYVYVKQIQPSDYMRMNLLLIKVQV